MYSLDILISYSFLVVALGTMLLAFSAGAVGCLTVIKGESLIGDAIGHASFPGIVLAFMAFGSRDPVLLLLGAFGSGALAFFYIHMMKDHSTLELDAVLAITLSTFFGFGMVLKTYVQGNALYQGASQSGLQTYIFGQAAYILKSDVYLMLVVSALSLALLCLCYKELKVYLFDEVYAQTIGVRRVYMHVVMLVATMCLIATGLKVVGSILIAALFILPAIIGLQWAHTFSRVLWIAALSGALCAFLGTYVSTLYEGMSTGPTIILWLSGLAFFSLVFGPRGAWSRNQPK